MGPTKFAELREYLRALPRNLPLPDPGSRVNQLLDFTLDEDWVADVGEEHAVNRGLEAALGNSLPRNDQGIFYLKQRGPAIEVLADVLEFWIAKYPGSPNLLLWLKNAIDSAKK